MPSSPADDQISFSNVGQDRELDCIRLDDIDSVGTNEVVIEQRTGLLASIADLCSGEKRSQSPFTALEHTDDELDEDSEALCLMIRTSPESRNLGRVYTYRAESREAFVNWKQLLNEAMERAKLKAEQDLWESRYPTSFTKFRARVRVLYDSRPAQFLLTLVVLFSYATDIAEVSGAGGSGALLAHLEGTLKP